MRLVLSGATGFLGRTLVRSLTADGHQLVVLTRGTPRSAENLNTVQWTPDGTVGPWAKHLEGADAVISLSGEPIAGRRWSRAQKQRIFDSRILATRSLATAIAGTAARPAALIGGSGIGYYGPHGDEVVTEETPAGSDFLAEVCKAWEAEAVAAERHGVRVSLLRTGVVLERDGGALREMMRPFTFFAGGPIGNGRQFMPWIHREDWIGIVRMLLRSPDARGAFNVTAPNPVTNNEFMRALGRAMRRPAFMRAPAIALKVALGEMAEALLLTGQRAVPARALATGYQFKYATVDAAFNAIFR